MPLQTFNFMQPVMQHDLSNLGNIFGNYYKGYEQARTPHKLAQQELAQNLFNEIQKVELQYKPQKYQADIGYTKAQTGHTNAQTGLTNQQARYYPQKIQSELDLNKAKIARQNDPLLRLTGPARDQASREAYLTSPLVTPEAKQRAIDSWKLADDMNRATLNQKNEINKYRDLSNMPADEKSALYAQYHAVGVPKGDVAELHRQRITPEAIAKWRIETNRHDEIPTTADLGLPSQGQLTAPAPVMQEPQLQAQPQAQAQAQGMPETDVGPQAMTPPPARKKVAPEVVPEYPATNANRTDINRTKGNVAEADYLHERVAEYAGEYPTRYAEHSPQYYADVILAKNPEKRARFIAGQIMGQDVALLNVKLAGGSNAHEAVSRLMGLMGFNAEIQGWTKDAKTYKRAMEIVKKDLTHAAKLRIDVMSGKKTENKSSEDDPAGIL